MFKYLGQHIFDFVSKFRNDVYFQNLEELEHNFSIVVGPDGQLAKSKGPAEKSIIEVRNDEGSVIPAGAPLYSKGEIGSSDKIKVGICDANNPAKMPCIGIAQYEMNTSDTKDNFAITQGVYNTNISGFTGLLEGDILYVNGGAAPYLTSTKPSNGNYIQNVGIVLKTNGTICQGLLVAAIGRTNDVPWPLYVDVPNSKVGIGTATPSQKLEVQGSQVKFTSTTSGENRFLFSSGDDGNNSTFYMYNSQQSNTVKIGSGVDSYFNGGNVGIGTTSPQQLLDIAATSTAPVLRLSRNQNIGGTSWAGESLGDIEFYTNDPSNAAVFGKISVIGGPDSGTPNAGYPDGHMVFYTKGQQGGALSEKLRITDTGNVGIGTTSPSSKLHLSGTTGAESAIRQSRVGVKIWDSQIDSSGRLTWSHYASEGGTANQLFTLDDNGNVGIGTTAPSFKLDVNAGTENIVASFSSTDQTAQLRIIEGSNVPFFFGVINSGAYISPTGATPADGISILNTGNVGIGIASPSVKLEIGTDGGGENKLRINSDVATKYLQFESLGNLSRIKATNGQNLLLESTGTGGYITFNANSAERMRILYDGKVGIGTTTPAHKLDVSGDVHLNNLQLSDFAGDIYFGVNSANNKFSYNQWLASASGGMVIKNTANASTGHIAFETSTGEALRIIRGGQLLLNGTTTSFSDKLYINGDAYVNGAWRVGTSGTYVGKLYNTSGILTLESDSTRDIQFGSVTNGTAMFIEGTNGRVGIGTTSPDHLLHVAGNSKMSNIYLLGNIIHEGDVDTQIKFATDTIKFDTAGSERLTINSTGNINATGNITVTKSSASIKVIETGGGDVRMTAGGATGYIGTYNNNSLQLVQNGSVALFVDTSKNVGIGTTSPSEKLDVVGNIKASGTIKGKMEQMFACSFSDDLGTTKHYIPFTSNAEQTNVHADQVAMVMPYGGRVKCIQMRLSNIDADTTRTLGIESIAPGVNMFQNAGNWTSEETEAYELVASDDYYLVNYVFSNETHFDSGDLMAISIQDSEDAHTASRQIYMNVIVEYDLNNGMGNDTATTKYTS